MWWYAQVTGELRDAAGHCVELGYSGKAEAKNDPRQQHLRDRGPIPRGYYTLVVAREHPRLGPVSIPLHPSPGNRMFGRDAFYVHGDKVSQPGDASTGCIVLSRAVRERIAASPDRRLRVIRAFRRPPTAGPG